MSELGIRERVASVNVKQATFDSLSEFLRVREFASAANVSQATVRSWILYGRLSVIRLSRRSVRIPKVELERLLREGFTPARVAR